MRPSLKARESSGIVGPCVLRLLKVEVAAVEVAVVVVVSEAVRPVEGEGGFKGRRRRAQAPCAFPASAARTHAERNFFRESSACEESMEKKQEDMLRSNEAFTSTHATERFWEA